MTATGSPTKRTRSAASRGRATFGLKRDGTGSSPRSAAVNTAITPGIARASAVSIAVIDAVGDRRAHVVGDGCAGERHVAVDAQVVDVATAGRDEPWVLDA